MNYSTNFKITADIEKYANDENFVLCLRKDVHDSTEEEVRRSIEFYDLFLADKTENKHYFPIAIRQLTFLEKKVKLLFKKKLTPKFNKNGKKRDFIIKRCDGIIVKEKNLIGISIEIKDSKVVQVITPKYYKLLEDIEHKNHMLKLKKILAGIRINEALKSIKSCKYLFSGFATKGSDITFIINSDMEKNILGSSVSYILRSKHFQSDDLDEKELAAKEIVAKELAAKELAAKELVAKEIVAKELAAKEIVAKEIVAKELAAKELAAKEIVAKELAAKELAAKELAAKELAAKELAANKGKKSEIFSLASSELIINENIWNFNLYESSVKKGIYTIPEGQYDYIKRDYENSSFKSSKISPYSFLPFNLYFYTLSVIVNISNYFRRSHV